MRFTTFLMKNLLRRKMRSLLTCVGIAVAVGTTVALLGISEGFETSMARSFSNKGTHIVVTDEGMLNQLNSELDESLGELLLKIEGVQEIGPGLLDFIQYETPRGAAPLLVQGWPLEGYVYKEIDMLQGDGLVADRPRQVVVGAKVANNLGLKLGDKLDILGEDFTISGIFESASFFDNSGAVIEIREFQELWAREGVVTGFSIIIDEPATKQRVDEVCRQINSLTDENGREIRISASPTDEYAQGAVHIQMAQAMAWMTSVIAIVVGSIGMLNTMVMSVVERIKEISILRAIGWRKSRIVRMILGESMILSLVGAVLGAIAAIVLTKWLTTLPAVNGFIEGDIAPLVVLKGFGLAALVGLAGGLYPAYRATKLLPSEGLRHE